MRVLRYPNSHELLSANDGGSPTLAQLLATGGAHVLRPFFFGLEEWNIQTRVTPIKLKPDALPLVRERQAEINNRKPEALSTMRHETVILECFWLEPAADGDYLICVMAAEGFQSEQAAHTSPHPIDAYHRQFKREAWESGQRLELLVELNRLEEYRSNP